MNFQPRAKILFFLLSIPLYGIETLELGFDKDKEYSLVLKTRMLKHLEVSWEGQFETPIRLGKPLNFKIKSTNGTLICYLLLTRKLMQYQLSYTFEVMIEPKNKEKIVYMKKGGETKIVLNEYIHISPWADVGNDFERLRKISKDGSVKHHEKKVYPEYKEKINGRDEIIFSFLVKRIE